MNPESELKYSAFISYSHHDRRWARWLQARLEAFRIDAGLLALVKTKVGARRRLAPVFRDRDDFAPGQSLLAETRAKLDASAALIVIASPRSAKSAYVNEEIRLFKLHHPERPVIPFIVDGRNGVPELEPFAPALRFAIDPDGKVTSTPIETLGADVRPWADGRSLALAKVVSQLLGVRPDAVFGRFERQRRMRNRLWAGAGAVAASLLVAAGVSFSLFQQERLRAENESNLKLASESLAAARRLEQVIAEGGDLNTELPQVAAVMPDPVRGRFRPYQSAAEASLLKGMQTLKLESTLLGHTGEITAISASPNWDWLATGSVDKTVRIWAAREKRLKHVLNGHADTVLHVLFDAASERVFTASADGKIGVWSMADGQRLRYLEGHTGDVTKLALSPDGRQLASAGVDGVAWVWDLTDYSGKPFRHVSVGWKPQLDGQGRPKFRSIEPTSGKFRSTLDHPQRGRRMATKGLGVTELIWMPNGDALLTSGEDGRVVRWTIATGVEDKVIEVDLGSPIYTMIADFIENTVVVGTDRLGSIWSLDKRSKLADLAMGIIVPLPSGVVPLVDMKPLGEGRVIVGYLAERGSTVWGAYLWNTRTGKFLTRLRPTETQAPVHAADSISDSTFLVEGVGTIPPVKHGTYTEIGGGLIAQDLTTFRRQPENVVRLTRFTENDQNTIVLKGPNSPVTATLLAPGFRHFIAGTKDGAVHIWNTNEKFIEDSIGVSDDPLVGVKKVAVADDAKTIAALNVAGQLNYWLGDKGNRKHTNLYQSKVFVKSVNAGSPAEKADLLPGDRLLSLEGEMIPTMQHFVRMVQRNPEKLLALKYERNEAIITTSITPVAQPVQDANGATRIIGRIGLNGEDVGNPARLFNAFHLSNNGDRLVAGARDGQVLMWPLNEDSARQDEPEPVPVGRHTRAITALAVDLDGRLAVTGGDDGVRIFELKEKREVRHIVHAALRDVATIYLSATSSKFMVAASNNRAVVFDTNDPSYEFVLPQRGLDTQFAVFLSDGKRVAVAQGEPASVPTQSLGSRP